ncbi:DUF895 domain membrane protein [Cichlidogyrus casuarinus]|uniref:UNC93-like protein MFSD11 n=1 Tax=Cichlidogyrus casuarinus TaxID=1844966 RepID=A0ABD2QJ55_9PLAT
MDWSLYLSAILVGVGATILWSGSSVYISKWSSKELINRNFSIFFSIFQLNNLIGGLVYYFMFSKVDVISAELRLELFLPMCIMILVAMTIFFFLPKPGPVANVASEVSPFLGEEDSPESSTQANSQISSLQTFLHIFKILQRKEILSLVMISYYSGANLSFQGGVLSACLSHTTALSAYPKSMVGLNMIFIGFGGISVFFIMLNFPPLAPIQSTPDFGFIVPNLGIALLCGFLLGLLDAGWNAQICSIVGRLYASNELDKASTYSLTKLVQSLAGAIGFFYGPYLILYYQIGILFVLGTFAMILVIPLEWHTQKLEKMRGDIPITEVATHRD